MLTLPVYVLITPARNEAQFIELTLKSVIAQTVLPLRWVIVSDGSTDGTDEIVSKYAVDHPWIEQQFIPTVQQRGAAVIKARGSSSAASAASAAIDHVRTWVLGTAAGDWTSMAIPSDGSYGIEEGLIYSYPVTCNNGAYEIVQQLPIDDFSRKRMDLSAAELREERDGVRELLGS